MSFKTGLDLAGGLLKQWTPIDSSFSGVTMSTTAGTTVSVKVKPDWKLKAFALVVSLIAIGAFRYLTERPRQTTQQSGLAPTASNSDRAALTTQPNSKTPLTIPQDLLNNVSGQDIRKGAIDALLRDATVLDNSVEKGILLFKICKELTNFARELKVAEKSFIDLLGALPETITLSCGWEEIIKENKTLETTLNQYQDPSVVSIKEQLLKLHLNWKNQEKAQKTEQAGFEKLRDASPFKDLIIEIATQDLSEEELRRRLGEVLTPYSAKLPKDGSGSSTAPLILTRKQGGSSQATAPQPPSISMQPVAATSSEPLILSRKTISAPVSTASTPLPTLTRKVAAVSTVTLETNGHLPVNGYTNGYQSDSD